MQEYKDVKDTIRSMEKKLRKMDSMIKTSEAEELAEAADTQKLMAHADTLLQCARPLANPHAAGLETPQPMKSTVEHTPEPHGRLDNMTRSFAEALDETEPVELMVIPDVDKDEKNDELTMVDDMGSQKPARHVKKLRGPILKATATSKEKAGAAVKISQVDVKKRKVHTEVEQCSPEIDNEKPKKRQKKNKEAHGGSKEAKAESSSAGSGKPPSESKPEKEGITKKDAQVSKLPKADPKPTAKVGRAASARSDTNEDSKAGDKALKGNEEDTDAKKHAPKGTVKKMKKDNKEEKKEEKDKEDRTMVPKATPKRAAKKDKAEEEKDTKVDKKRKEDQNLVKKGKDMKSKKDQNLVKKGKDMKSKKDQNLVKKGKGKKNGEKEEDKEVLLKRKLHSATWLKYISFLALCVPYFSSPGILGCLKEGAIRRKRSYRVQGIGSSCSCKVSWHDDSKHFRPKATLKLLHPTAD